MHMLDEPAFAPYIDILQAILMRILDVEMEIFF